MKVLLFHSFHTFTMKIFYKITRFATCATPPTELTREVSNLNYWNSLVEVLAESWWEQSLSGNGLIGLSPQDRLSETSCGWSAPATTSHNQPQPATISLGETFSRIAPAWEGTQYFFLTDCDYTTFYWFHHQNRNGYIRPVRNTRLGMS